MQINATYIVIHPQSKYKPVFLAALFKIKLTMQSSWVCSACSYSNPNSVTRCSLCNSLRPSPSVSEKEETTSDATISISSSMEIGAVNTLSQQSSKFFSVDTNKTSVGRKTLGAKRTLPNSQRSAGLSRLNRQTLSLSESDIPKSGEVSRAQSIHPSKEAVEEKEDSSEMKEKEDSSEMKEKEDSSEMKEKEESTEKKEKKERKSHTSLKKKPKISSIKLVGTMLSEVDSDIMAQLIMYLPNAKLMKRKSVEKANVVVTGRSARSVKVMCAVARGCAVVSTQWLYDCMEKGEWLPVNEYIDEIAKEGLENRKKSKHGVFQSMGPFYIQSNTSPSYEELKSIIEAGDGKVTRTLEKATICISSENLKDLDVPCVNERFVIEGVMMGKPPKVEDYCMNSQITVQNRDNVDSEEY